MFAHNFRRQPIPCEGKRHTKWIHKLHIHRPNLPPKRTNSTVSAGSVPVYFMFTQIDYHWLPRYKSVLTPQIRAQNSDGIQQCLHSRSPATTSDITVHLSWSMRDPRAASSKSQLAHHHAMKFRSRPWIAPSNRLFPKSHTCEKKIRIKSIKEQNTTIQY